MTDVMTDRKFDKIIAMIAMILEGCKDLDEAKAKLAELRAESKPKDDQ